MKKLILTVIPFLAINLMATEIKLDGKYAYALGNPFKEKLEVKTKSVSITKSESKLVHLDVKTNLPSNSLVNPGNFSIDQNACEFILQKYVSEDFNVKDVAKTKVSCKILPSTVILDYHEDQHMHYLLRDVNMDVNIELDVEQNGKNILSKQLNTKMNRALGIKGDEYDWTIRYTFDFEHESVDESIQKILEYSIFQLISSELSDKKGTF